MKKIVIASAFVFGSFAVQAADVAVLGGGMSYHFKHEGQNQVHPSTGVQIDNFSVLYTTKNSIELPSLQVAYGDNFFESKVVDFGYRVGLATGYRKGHKYSNGEYYYDGHEIGNTGLLPLVTITTTIHTPIPKLDLVADTAPNVVMFGFKYNL
ncbi:antimicrobial peptide resistance and lipid A acylation protein PagP [Aeromonas phage LAh10]|uniref:Uncharacterized protein n=1 Tax=Aeromonas phage LAh10 TaxID=2591025 RepID=A0A514A1L6_9CAUD|nr:antimicrobial peptide resistance and lipid A acylation protein PagP [Aeromonas phage LAh10]QDH47180.1 hypothetical protein LAh10_81 [Aeromonas phage LAh10]